MAILIYQSTCVSFRFRMKRHPIDTAWFLARMESQGLSMHTLAPRVKGLSGPLTYSNFYRLIHGERAMSLSEGAQLATLLGVSIEEIAHRALGRRR